MAGIATRWMALSGHCHHRWRVDVGRSRRWVVQMSAGVAVGGMATQDTTGWYIMSHRVVGAAELALAPELICGCDLASGCWKDLSCLI